MTHSPSFVYFGTPAFSTFVLDELEKAGLVPALVVTTPDKPAGRGLQLQQSPVKEWAMERSIQVAQPETFDDAFVAMLSNVAPEILIVAAYGKILPARVLSVAKKGALNVHPSLLPRYRGTSPVESQILAGEKDVGVSVIVMDEKMDHGPLLAQEKASFPTWPVSRGTLNDMLWHMGGALLARSIPPFLEGDLVPYEQHHDAATVTKKITKEDGLLTDTMSEEEKYRKYLAYEGWPGTHVFHGAIRVKIKTATYKDGVFIPLRVIPEGKAEMNYADL